jgi:hypothetical protein
VSNLTIGYVENSQGDMVFMWFYKMDGTVWKRFRTDRVHKSSRETILKQVMSKAQLVPLARGT